MDVSVSTRYSNSDSRNHQQNRSSSQPQPSASGSAKSPATPTHHGGHKHVNFSGHSEEKKREKFLTAKYGAHQMALIRKRLRVEMWMYERLQELYGADDIEIDLDEVLDMDTEIERREYIQNLLREAQAANDSVNIFVGDLLEKVKTL